MSSVTPYNPLDKVALAKSIEAEMLRRDAVALAACQGIIGAGVYAIYYCGDFPAYAPLSIRNRNGRFEAPIYVGKAIPKGGRKGGLSLDAGSGNALAARLAKHASSVSAANNINVVDFFARHLVVEDIWIPLGENILIETFSPLWNKVVDGFGNNDPGTRRATQYRSAWDVLHPGRIWAEKLAPSPLNEVQISQRIADFLSGKPTPEVDSRDEDSEADA